MPPFLEHQFKREEHVYANEAFSELLKDAVRFFHGTPVLPLPPQTSFTGAGVYAIYCIAKTGIYKDYGERINRLGYHVPIYVGKAISKGTSFHCLSIDNQFAFWQRCFQTTLMMSPGDFAFRVVQAEDTPILNGLYNSLVKLYRPFWNLIFKESVAANEVEKDWCSYHRIRFHRKAMDSRIIVMEKMLAEYLTAI